MTKLKGGRRFMSRLADFLAEEVAPRSWEEVLTPQERLGGPSPFGSSKWQDFKNCPYLYELKYVKRYRPEVFNDALEIGGLFHEALARYFSARLGGASFSECKAQAYDIVNRAGEVAPEASARVRVLLDHWMTMYHDTRYSFADRVIAVEILVEKPKPFMYSARLDLVLEHRGGVEIMDHKTARMYDSNMLMSYRLEPQFTGHMYLWEGSQQEKDYGPLKKYTVDLITKTKIPTLDLVDVPIRPYKIRQWSKEMQEHWRWFQKYRKGIHVWPRRTGYQCRFCAAFEHCASDDDNLRGWIKKSKGEY